MKVTIIIDVENEIFSGKTPRIRNQLNVCQQLMVQLSTQSAPEFSDIVDSSGLPHKLLQILTLGPSMCFDEKNHFKLYLCQKYFCSKNIISF